MGLTLPHVLAGGLGLVFGYTALFAAKGGTLHRKSGMLFVGAMLTMAVFGIALAVGRPWQAVNVPAGVLTGYLVITALTTVRPPAAGSRWLDIGAMLVALAVGLTVLAFGFEALARAGRRNGVPAFPFLMFGAVGLLAGIGDFRMLRSGGRHGAARLRRHLWRMCFGLYIAAASFFLVIDRPIGIVRALLRMLGQPDEFPQALRNPALFAVPVVVPLLAMLYWLWRVRTRRIFRGMAGIGATEAVSAARP